MSRRASVVIIGGGVTGASIAFHLADAGVRDVLVLERKALASGGTGRSVGIVRQLYPTAETSRMVVRSLAVFQRFRDAVGGESGYVACGALIGVSAAMRAKLEATVILQRSVGVRAEVLEPRDLARPHEAEASWRRGGRDALLLQLSLERVVRQPQRLAGPQRGGRRRPSAEPVERDDHELTVTLLAGDQAGGPPPVFKRDGEEGAGSGWGGVGGGAHGVPGHCENVRRPKRAARWKLPLPRMGDQAMASLWPLRKL